jgi:superfamily II DNA or RNA helicase
MLRPYQQKLALDAVDALKTHNKIVVCSPTGSGKTITAINGIVPFLPRPILWVTHRLELLNQAEALSKDFDVSMVMTADVSKYKSIIIDEGHHSCADTYFKLIKKTGSAKVIALTATPYRLDGKGLGLVGFTKIIIGDDIFQLTNDGHLCPCEVFIPESQNRLSWNPIAVAQEVSRHKFKQALIYCRRVDDAFRTAKELTKKGVKSSAVCAECKLEDRQEIIEKFRQGKIKAICNHTILTEGTDLPKVDLIVLNRMTHSRALWRQMIGRGLRISEGKEFCKVLDLASNSVLHGSIYDKEIYDLNGRIISTEQRYIETNTEKETTGYEYQNGEKLKQWKPIPELKIIRRTLLTLNAALLKSKLLTATRVN